MTDFLLVAFAQFLVGDDRKSAEQTGDVEGLGWRDQRDDVFFDLAREFCHRGEFIVVEQQLRMNFIRYDEDVMLEAQFRHLC